jgi:Domain of unknown function (DUF4407)
MRRLLSWLSGAQSRILDLAETDRGKYEGIGSAVLITASLAAISMTFALHTALAVVLPLAIGAGVVWGLAIMSLDRWLVLSIQRRKKAWQMWAPAVPRLLLALLFGAIISTPLVLQIFKPEIDLQITKIKQREASAFLEEQNKQAIGQDIAAKQKQVTDLQKIIASGGDVAQDPTTDEKIKGLQSQVATQQKARDKAYKEWQCQLYGPCKPTGPGPLADADHKVYLKVDGQVSTLNAQIEARKRELTANDANGKKARLGSAQAALPGVQRELATLTSQQEARQRENNDKNAAANGLLIRLKALGEVSKGDSTLEAARILLFLFFTAIECLPIFVKLLHTLGEPNSYDKILAMEEKRQIRAAQQKVRKRQMDEMFADDDESDADDQVRAIWDMPAADPPPGPGHHGSGAAPAGVPEPEPTVSEADPLGGQDIPDEWEDDQLRNMRDGQSSPNGSEPNGTRFYTGKADATPAGATPAGERVLFPEDDGFGGIGDDARWS